MGLNRSLVAELVERHGGLSRKILESLSSRGIHLSANSLHSFFQYETDLKNRAAELQQQQKKRPGVIQLDRLIRQHNGNIAAIAKALSTGARKIGSQEVSYWIRKDHRLFEILMTIKNSKTDHPPTSTTQRLETAA